VLTHTKDTKIEVLNEFLAKGGVLLSAGLTEGVDLKDDLARLNIIVSCRFPNLGSDYVQKKKAQPGGNFWYMLETIKQTVQALGRTTRNEKDYSVSIILDGRFAGLYSKTKDELPRSFREAIVWQSVSYVDIMARANKFILDK
jgi:Rad3-related DNA helicase